MPWGDVAFGGLTLILWLRPRTMVETIAERPELLVLIAFAVPAVAASGTDLPRAAMLLIPFWLFVLGG